MLLPFSPVSLALAFPLARHIFDERHRAADQARASRAAGRSHARLRADDPRESRPVR